MSGFENPGSLLEAGASPSGERRKDVFPSPEGTKVSLGKKVFKNSLFPWVLVGAGCALIGHFLFTLPLGAPSGSAGTSEEYSPWRKELVGKRVVLPEKDFLGRPIEKGRSYFAFSLSQSCCMSSKGLIESVSGANLLPVILFAVGGWDRIPQEVLARGDLFRVVFSKDAEIPEEMIHQASQVVFLSPEGVIQAVLEDKELMREFFRRYKP